MGPLVLLLIVVVVLIFVLPPVALAKANQAQRKIAELARRVAELETQLRGRRTFTETSEAEADERFPESKATAPREPAFVRPAAPPPLPAAWVPPIPEPAAHQTYEPVSGPAITPPALKPAFDWEQFMGAKLFAWIGGLALFLGVAFFVKYSFERNLVPPEVRVAIGFLAGIALVIGGVAMKRKANVVTAQTFCATGILILYAVTFACRSFYHFSFFGLIPTFLLMSLITAVAFLLAIRLDALVVAVLGIAGGFLTPVLLSTGQDNPAGLFGYIALLDIGLLLVATRKDWASLPILGALGTVLMEITWVEAFFVRGQYFEGTKTLIPMTVFVGFAALFAAAALRVKSAGKVERATSAAAVAVAGFAMLWAFYFLSFSMIARRPMLLFSYLFAADLILLVLAFAKSHFNRWIAAIGILAFLFLSLWTSGYLRAENLYSALGAYFLFAVLHAATPLVMQRLGRATPIWTAHLFPAITLLLVLLPIFRLHTSSLLIWPLVLSGDVLALLVAMASGIFAAVFVVLVLTLVVLGAWILELPTRLVGLPFSLVLVAGFAVFFVVAATWMSRRLLKTTGSIGNGIGRVFGSISDPANFAIQLPALSATLPFLLLILAALKLPLTNPSPVFGVALVLVALLLGMTQIFSLDLVACVALVAVVGLEHSWHAAHFSAARAMVPLLWYLGFGAIFTIFPFLFHRQFAKKTLVWAASALALPFHFFLIYDVIRRAYPNGMLGLLPAALSLPLFAALFVVQRRTSLESPARISQLALFGGAALFFITLIFPIQFDRQWITIGWALEGAALCWLFHRVPHPGLRIAAVGLLVISFARLALNPAVLDYHARAATPIFNWYLYTYGLVALSFFVAARLLAPPRQIVLGKNAPPLLYTLGTVLAFLLLNIEIADYFSAPGTTTLTFQFTGNFGRDMSYSIAWALFALALLIVGIRLRQGATRWAGLGLLSAAILKLFLHDLSQLDQLYRIVAFIVVAAIAILASFLYQRFLAATKDEIS